MGEFVEGGGQLIQRDGGDGGHVRIVGENLLTGDAEDIAERVQAFVLTGKQVDKGEAKRFVGGQGVNKTAVNAGELTQGEVALVEGVELFDAVCLEVVGDEQRVGLIVFVPFGQRLAEMLDVHGVEQGELGLEGGEVGVVGDVIEDVPPVETGGFADGGEGRGRVAAGEGGQQVLLEGEEARPVVVVGAMGEGKTAVGGRERVAPGRPAYDTWRLAVAGSAADDGGGIMMMKLFYVGLIVGGLIGSDEEA